jgi:hypothetical protein
VTGLHSKKRPDDLVFTRIFDGRVLDMIELGIDEIKDMGSFKVCSLFTRIDRLMRCEQKD